MFSYKRKFNLLRHEVVKANNELADDKVFTTYMDEEQDTVMLTNGIVKSLVKTIKFYEQADHKLNTALEYRLESAVQELATNDNFREWVDFYRMDKTIDKYEVFLLALPKTICELDNINKDYKDEVKKQDKSLESAQKVIEKLKEEIEDQKIFTTDANNQVSRMSKYIVDLERKNKQLEDELEESKDLVEKNRKELKIFKKAELEKTEELAKVYLELDSFEDEAHTLASLYNTEIDKTKALENRLTETKETLEKFRKENRLLKSVNLDLRQEIIKQDRKLRIRNNEIAGLKHMLERIEDEINDTFEGELDLIAMGKDKLSHEFYLIERSNRRKKKALRQMNKSLQRKNEYIKELEYKLDELIRDKEQLNNSLEFEHYIQNLELEGGKYVSFNSYFR